MQNTEETLRNRSKIFKLRTPSSWTCWCVTLLANQIPKVQLGALVSDQLKRKICLKAGVLEIIIGLTRIPYQKSILFLYREINMFSWRWRIKPCRQSRTQWCTIKQEDRITKIRRSFSIEPHLPKLTLWEDQCLQTRRSIFAIRWFALKLYRKNQSIYRKLFIYNNVTTAAVRGGLRRSMWRRRKEK